MATLHELLHFCMARDLGVEFRTSSAMPGEVEILAHMGDHHFSQRFKNEDWASHPEEAFTAFLGRARSELLRLEAARPTIRMIEMPP